MVKLRSHQRSIFDIASAIARSETSISDILAAVTPGGGKSLLPVISAALLKKAGMIDRICWIVPRDTLRLQAEEAFTDNVWRQALGHRLRIRAAENRKDLCRGMDGYVTTYQAIAAAPDLHLSEFRKHRYLIAVDELHHLPAVSASDRTIKEDDETSWSLSLLPLLETARVRLLMSGTLERSDGKPILWLPYKKLVGKAGAREIDFSREGWAMVGYSRRQALAEKAILPVTFGAMDASAKWLDAQRMERSVDTLTTAFEDGRAALFTALRTDFATSVLREAYLACRTHRSRRRQESGIDPAKAERGLGKLLVIAPDQATARQYARTLSSWMPDDQAKSLIGLAVSNIKNSHEVVAAYRLRPNPSILVSVAMAYEGLDCPEISHVACLTHIRSRPWLEQAIARATRVDPRAGAYESQSATIYHPDDPLFRRFREVVETQQGTRAQIKRRRSRQGELQLEEPAERHAEIIPLSSQMTGMSFRRVEPGPDFGYAQGLHEPEEAPSALEHQLRQKIGQMVATQLVEDQDASRSDVRIGYHGYNAVLKRVMGGKPRAELTIPELEATVGWLERNRLMEHIHLLENDPRYHYTLMRSRSPKAKTQRSQTTRQQRQQAQSPAV